MDPEESYQSDTVLSFVFVMEEKIERRPPRGKHAEVLLHAWLAL